MGVPQGTLATGPEPAVGLGLLGRCLRCGRSVSSSELVFYEAAHGRHQGRRSGVWHVWCGTHTSVPVTEGPGSAFRRQITPLPSFTVTHSHVALVCCSPRHAPATCRPVVWSEVPCLGFAWCFQMVPRTPASLAEASREGCLCSSHGIRGCTWDLSSRWCCSPGLLT